MILRVLNILFVLLLAFSCSRPDLAECERLSMKKYKGIPNASRRFDSYCMEMSIKYTVKLCQQAFVEYTMNGNEQQLKEKYGENIINCFTRDDLNRFAK